MAKRPASANEFREIGQHASDDFIEAALPVRNHPAPGLLLGDFMAKARHPFPRPRVFEALKNTARFLPTPPHAHAVPLVESGRSKRAAFHNSLPGN
ncbi:hypothetical protein [Pseudodesulfovibrio sp.]|uniref:hypothetical protein n=1 Tax=Pseudodesulfovibrio sp. TaxID=2035812 RepID=UPI003D0BD566